MMAMNFANDSAKAYLRFITRYIENLCYPLCLCSIIEFPRKINSLSEFLIIMYLRFGDD